MNARPASVPSTAVFNAADNEWELGERRGALNVGEWTWWRPDGTLVGTSPFDDEGKPHGLCRRYHPNGELSLEAMYRHGVAHGKQLMTNPTSGDSLENVMLRGLKGMVRMDTLNIDGVPQGIATYYNLEGATEPVPHDAQGRSVDLGAHVTKLLPKTALTLVTPFLHGMMGKVPTSMASSFQYICLAIIGGTSHRIQYVDANQQETMTIVEAAEISRAMTLTVDYRAAQL